MLSQATNGTYRYNIVILTIVLKYVLRSDGKKEDNGVILKLQTTGILGTKIYVSTIETSYDYLLRETQRSIHSKESFGSHIRVEFFPKKTVIIFHEIAIIQSI